MSRVEERGGCRHDWQRTARNGTGGRVVAEQWRCTRCGVTLTTCRRTGWTDTDPHGRTSTRDD